MRHAVGRMTGSARLSNLISSQNFTSSDFMHKHIGIGGLVKTPTAATRDYSQRLSRHREQSRGQVESSIWKRNQEAGTDQRYER